MNAIVRDYETGLPRYEALRERVIAEIGERIAQAGLKIHHITGRVKKPASLAEKLRRKPGRYAALDDVTDLVGVRIITYFESDVQVVARLIESAFTVDWNNSSDKSRMHDPDRFGYMGMHYVAQVPGAAEGTPLSFEVQIRSILQHAWAEIEHDLGYKSREAVPREVSRRFYRLAGLLEMADEEFMAIARMSRDYAATLPQRVEGDPDHVYLDLQSVTYLLGTPFVQALDEQVAAALGVGLLLNWPGAGHPHTDRSQRLAQLLHYTGVHSVGQLRKELLRYQADIVAFATGLMTRLSSAWTPAGGARPGTSLVHYALLRACENPDIDAGRVIQMLGLGTLRDAETMTRMAREVYAQQYGPAGRPQGLSALPGGPLPGGH